MVCSVGEKYAKWNCYLFVNRSTTLKLAWKYLFRLVGQLFCVKKNLYDTVYFSVKKKKVWAFPLTSPQ